MMNGVVSRERSRELYRRACELMPAGVNSPVRAFRSVGGEPLFIRRGVGAHLEDEDGNAYLDCCGSWGPLILGHGHPTVLTAIEEALAEGLTYGAPHKGEIALAELVTAAYPAVEMLRFVSSGTEAVMSAVRLARGFTGRDLIVKFTGCYHGHADALLVEAGSGLATLGIASSAGVPAGAVADTRLLPLDDEARVEALFAREGGRVAAVLVEPVPANCGLLLQRPEYLRFLRAITERHGALLIFDEVISGFRIGMGGAAARYGVRPDLATFGKVIGGGMPVGAFGGRREIMSRLAPLGPVYQAGTLSGNPIAMAAGAATLRALAAEGVHERLESLGARLEERVAPVASATGSGFARIGSIFWLVAQSALPRTFEAVRADAMQRYAAVHARLLAGGVYLAPSGWEVAFLSHAMDVQDVDRLGMALVDAITAD